MKRIYVQQIGTVFVKHIVLKINFLKYVILILLDTAAALMCIWLQA